MYQEWMLKRTAISQTLERFKDKWPVVLGRVTYLPAQWMVHLRKLTGHPVLARGSVQQPQVCLHLGGECEAQVCVIVKQVCSH